MEHFQIGVFHNNKLYHVHRRVLREARNYPRWTTWCTLWKHCHSHECCL